MAMTIKVSKLQPLAGYVLVEPAKADEKTSSGIYLPSSNEEKPQYGTVLACGEPRYEGGQKIECQVKKGDQVVYKKWGGNDFEVNETEYQFLKFEDVLAIIKK
ncbi:MAG: co-chaperone GroES [Candidatus Pacebacteria bacterium]|jgi:chaperonin GroES|nr:co-chaperone GroES [Candidatus Paceibacterota bacterium]MBT3511605.1 co-chaperone GroES [Candidatus Paceibacterota bacterium]MBT4004694.1 co-chaperone GroES [Candidatus Paceibacterota bacterium]MBT6899315.1 co-chaperone GroES [Candidatus Paceibacterota bacterium]MBT7183270.1 co-chaperone GroES [Candidatus Paceibacterota bacterium]